MKKITAIIGLVLLLAATQTRATLIDKIVATVNGKPITLYELKNIAGFYNAKNPKQLLNQVIDDYLIEEYAQNVGISVSNEDVLRYMENIAAKNNLTLNAFVEKLKKSGIDISYYKKGIKLFLYRIKFARRVFMPSIKITKQDIESYYKLHKNQLQNSNKIVILSIITLNSLKQAKKILNLLDEGKNFYELQEKYSLTKDKTRYIPLSALNPYLQTEILNLRKGQHTNIIESEGKFYIVKLIKIEEEKNIDQQIRNILIDQRIKAKLNSWLRMVRVRSDIEIFMK